MPRIECSHLRSTEPLPLPHHTHTNRRTGSLARIQSRPRHDRSGGPPRLPAAPCRFEVVGPGGRSSSCGHDLLDPPDAADDVAPHPAVAPQQSSWVSLLRWCRVGTGAHPVSDHFRSSSHYKKTPSAQKPKEDAAPAPAPLSFMPAPSLHLQNRPYLLQPINLATPAAPDNKVIGSIRPVDLQKEIRAGTNSSPRVCHIRCGAQIVYEVTLEVDEDIVPAYLEWIRQGHIQVRVGSSAYMCAHPFVPSLTRSVDRHAHTHYTHPSTRATPHIHAGCDGPPRLPLLEDGAG